MLLLQINIHTNKRALGEKSSVSLKVAATSSPPMQFRSPIGDAVSPLRCSPLCVGARAALPRPSAPALCLAPRPLRH